MKLAAFVAATFSLSLFFEGWRRVHQSPTLDHSLVLAAGVLLTLFLLWLQALWIYLEEKSKGTLTKRVVHFDKLEGFFVRQSICSDKIEKGCEDSVAGGAS